jgi:hypothetical protein
MTYVCVPYKEKHLRQALRRFANFLCLALIAAGTSPLLAQQFATLNLTVTDPSGSVVPQAKVSIQNTDTGVLRTALSDNRGLVEVPGLPAGQYRLNSP